MSKESVILERRFIPAGTLVVRQGEDGSSAYLIQSGKVRVYTEHDDKEVELAILDMGQIFGEMALIFDEPRTATVKTIEDCNLIIITRQTLKQKLGKTDPTVRAIVEMLTRRVITGNNSVMKRQDRVEDLTETANTIYQNILSGLPSEQRGAFESEILPKLDTFLNALRNFQKGFHEV
ncbi:MAG: cyclic nucleotide-binding domain-containing protein [Alphaproteobacteria bacterium]|nr:cyclic nucleotide-binding domain-containing protein [Alphaproteobacteria bacterium]